MITTIIIFIIILGILVLVHEFGHFWVAKKSGMEVEEFGFGFPPRLFGIQKTDGRWKIVWGHRTSGTFPEEGTRTEASDATIYSINAIPFGGFVRILGENNEDAHNPRSFINRPFWPRFATLVAGVTMNWILAVVVFSLAFMIGVTAELVPGDPLLGSARVTNPQVAISYVAEGLPAAQAGVEAGDILVSIDGNPFTHLEEVQEYVQSHKGGEMQFTVQRINEEKTFTVKSEANPKEGEGPTGVALANIGTVKLPFLTSIGQGVAKTWYMTKAIVGGMWNLFFKPLLLPFWYLVSEGQWVGFEFSGAASQVGGPVKIAQLTGQVADLGFVPLLNFMGLLSVNLAILNILPIPALDGGRVVFLVVEKLRGKRNNQKFEQIVNTAGFLALLALMVVVTIKDIIGR